MSTISQAEPEIPSLDGQILAYTDLTSVAQGGAIHFHVWIDTNDTSHAFSVDIHRHESSPVYITTLNGTSSRQTTNTDAYINGCGWQSSLEYNVPSDLPSGAYRASFSTELNGNTYTYYTI